MVRYLTPAKICLLVLLELYVEEAVPSEATLPVLSFITSHLLDRDSAHAVDRSSRWTKAERTASLIVAIKDFEKLLSSYPFLMGMPGRRLWDQFLDKLWRINSLDTLHQFMNDLPQLLVKTKAELQREIPGQSSESERGIELSRNSLLGSFIRRARVELSRLPWHDVTTLWKDFVRYRQPTLIYIQRKNASFGEHAFDRVLSTGQHEGWACERVAVLASIVYGDMLDGDKGARLPVSTDDIEVLLEFQIEQMQKYGSRIPISIRDQFQDLLKDSTLIPSLNHYIHFLDAWRAGDFPASFDLLHRYFDYTMQNRDRYFYQYALMNLAVLQADFGCYKEAVAAMLETVSTARENRDMTCLNFALNWLYHFGRAHPSLLRNLESNSMLGTGKDGLAFLRVKARETGMWTLWSSVLLSEAKLSLMNGDSVATSFESLVRSSQIIVEKNMKNMFASHMSVLTSVWGRLGIAHMSTMVCEAFLRCHAHDSMFDEELKITCRLSAMLVDRGKYNEALRILESLNQNSLRSWKSKQYWHKYKGIIKLKRDLHHNNLDGAEQLLSQLLQSKNDDMEPDFTYLIDLLRVDCLIRRGDLQDAFEKIEVLLSNHHGDHQDVAIRVRLMLLKHMILDKCGRHHRGFTIVIRAASLAWQARLMPQLWASIGAAARILVSAGAFEAAAQLLAIIIPRALECELSDLAGQLYSSLADAHMGLAGEGDVKSARRTERITFALRAVQKAFDHFSTIEDIGKQCEMMAKKAMIMKLSGDLVLAADYAAAYVNLRNAEEAYRARPA